MFIKIVGIFLLWLIAVNSTLIVFKLAKIINLLNRQKDEQD